MNELWKRCNKIYAILLNNKENWSRAIHRKMDGTEEYWIKQSNLGPEQLHALSHVWLLAFNCYVCVLVGHEWG